LVGDVFCYSGDFFCGGVMGECVGLKRGYGRTVRWVVEGICIWYKVLRR